MKKVRVLLLCIMAVMLMACLAGCSSRRDNDTNQNTSAAGSTTAGESGSGTAAQGTESTRQDGTEDSTNNYGDDMNSTENENGAGSTGSTPVSPSVLPVLPVPRMRTVPGAQEVQKVKPEYLTD